MTNDSKQTTVTIVDFLKARLDEDEERLKFTTARGRWEAHRNYKTQQRGLVRHQPTEDTLAEFVYPADAEHAVRWQPSRVLAEIAAKRAIIEFHKQWPILVDTPPKIERDDSAGLDSVAFRMTRQITWATEQEYRKRFGDEPPTTPMMRALASVYSDHPDYREEWKP